MTELPEVSEPSKAEKIAKILIGKSVKDAKDMVIGAHLRMQIITYSDTPLADLPQGDMITMLVKDGKVIKTFVGIK